MSKQPATQKLSVIVPVYNEENTLEQLLTKVCDIALPVGFSLEIILVNDGSTDSSQSIAQQYVSLCRKNQNVTIRLINNQRNVGKSASVKKGILASIGDWVVIQDADLEYEPKDIVKLLNLAIGVQKPKQFGQARSKPDSRYVTNLTQFDVVYGNRFTSLGQRKYMKFYLGNRILSFFSNIFTYPRIKVWIPDMEVCYKLVKGGIMREIAQTLTATTTFGFEPEITARLAKYRKTNGEHLKFAVVPISYTPRSIEDGKKIRPTDGLKALGEIVKYNLFNN